MRIDSGRDPKCDLGRPGYLARARAVAVAEFDQLGVVPRVQKWERTLDPQGTRALSIERSAGEMKEP